ncbi:MAG: hypothetical protein OEY62_08395 [Acidimicrobiia bacterium]|nr:hypothetical protein [Acidimicrobiia bacterium]
MVAVGLAVGLSSYPVADLDATNQLVRLIGVAGVVLMVAAMVIGVPWLVGWATVTLVTEYAFSLLARPSVDVWASLYAAALFLMVESAYATLERRARIAGPSGEVGREMSRLLVVGSAAVAVAALVLALASIPVAYGLLVQVAGVGAAAAVLTTLILLVRQRA